MKILKWTKQVKLTSPLAPHLATGKRSEQRARRYLINCGLKHIESNYRCRHGEIDLVMEDNGYLVFVEVRFRKNEHYGGAAASIGAGKIRKLRSTAEHYLQRKTTGEQQPCRFDAVLITNTSLEWIKNAL